MFFVPLPQSPRCLTDVFLTTVYCSTLVTVYYSTLLLLGALVIWPYQYLFNGPVTSKVCLNATLHAGAFDAFPQALNIWDNYVSHTRWAINKVKNKKINDNQEENGTNHVGNTTQDTSTSSSNNQTSTTSRGRPSIGHIVTPTY